MYIFNYKMFHQEASVETIKLFSLICTQGLGTDIFNYNNETAEMNYFFFLL